MSGTDPQRRQPPQYGEYATPEEQRAAIKQPADWQLEAATDAAAAPPAPTAYQPGAAPRPPQGPPSGPHWPEDESRPPQASQVPMRAGFGDRLITFVLLGFGLYNVVDTIVNALSGGALARESGAALGEEESQLIRSFPAWFWMGTAVVYAVVWLVTLLISLSAMRAGRRAFWIPVLGAILAGVLLIALMAIVIGQNPGLLDNLPTPTEAPGSPS